MDVKYFLHWDIVCSIFSSTRTSGVMEIMAYFFSLHFFHVLCNENRAVSGELVGELQGISSSLCATP